MFGGLRLLAADLSRSDLCVDPDLVTRLPQGRIRSADESDIGPLFQGPEYLAVFALDFVHRGVAIGRRLIWPLLGCQPISLRRDPTRRSQHVGDMNLVVELIELGFL